MESGKKVFRLPQSPNLGSSSSMKSGKLSLFERRALMNKKKD